MRRLSPRESRLVAIALLLAAIAVIEVGAVRPLLDGFAARARQRQDLLARYAANDRLIGAIPRLRREAARRDGQAADYTLAAGDAAAAAQTLRDRLLAASNAAGGDFHGAEDIARPDDARPDDAQLDDAAPDDAQAAAAPSAAGSSAAASSPARGSPSVAATRVSLRLPAAQLTRFLALVENTRPFVTVTALAVRGGDTPVTDPAATLDITLEAAIAFRPAAAR